MVSGHYLKMTKINEALIILKNEKANRQKRWNGNLLVVKRFPKPSDKLMSEIFQRENDRRIYLRNKNGS